ncbi:hypothetical protein EVB39_013 [Rhizobium phage RHph_TM3_3_9]|nr:hypothetical protein EVB39_013 [Rhizobium phage RHph_TM3_3_9]QIG68534.1 hypothetical protein EVB66_013 [Rhizobium phage RHph_TM3_3_13]QIG74392.1 hypothetical protein EVC09_012 [Rhizobium phage RHph_TM3_3_10]QXV74505.1 hypothetical protein [Rhizobium phage RHEph19]
MTIRIGDTVKIVTPEMFVRCGYPFDQVKATQDLIDYYSDDIQALVNKVDPNARYPKYFGSGKDFRDLCGRIARIVATRHGFGGKQRRIHTERKESLTGLRCSVIGRKAHKTGDYYPARGYEDDYEPGGLDNEKTHVILTLQPIWFYGAGGQVLNRFEDVPSTFQIERIHVEKEETA